MLLKHKMDSSILTADVRDLEDPLGTHWVKWEDLYRRKRIKWMQDLSEVVCHAHFCRMLVVTGNNSILLVGRQSDREVCEFVLVTLVRFAEEESQRAFWRERSARQKKSGSWAMGTYRTSWLAAFVMTVADRYFAMECAAKTGEGAGVALVLTRSREEVNSFLNDWFEKRDEARGGKRKRKKTRAGVRQLADIRSYNEAGINAGRAAAMGVDLTGKAIEEGEEEGPSVRGSLGSGE